MIKYCGTPNNPILQGKKVGNQKICRKCKTINLMSANACAFCGLVFSTGEKRNYDYLNKLTLVPAKKDESDIIEPKTITIDWGNKSKSGQYIPKMTIRDYEKAYFIWLFGGRTAEITAMVGEGPYTDYKAKIKKFYKVKEGVKLKLIKSGNYYDFRVL